MVKPLSWGQHELRSLAGCGYSFRGCTMMVVTGASGLLGASVVLQVRRLGLAVAGLYHCHPLQIPGTAMRRADLVDFAATRELMRNLKPGTIIHCAAATSVDWCESHPEETEEINVRASALLAEMACELGARLVYISTDAVFDGGQGNYSETDPARPGQRVRAGRNWPASVRYRSVSPRP